MTNEIIDSEKLAIKAVATVAILFILSILTFCSIDEYYENKTDQAYIEKGCLEATLIGTNIEYWQCPDENPRTIVEQ